MSGPEPAARLDAVVVEYPGAEGPVRAVDGVSLEVPRASSLAVVGRSGSGKSSLIGVLGLMRRPAVGAAWVTSPELPRHRRIGMVFQSFHLEPHLTAQENCMLAWYCEGGAGPARAARDRAGEILDLLGVAHLRHRRAGLMSGGERQRVAIARALFGDPALLIADEPTGNLDEDNAARVRDLLFGLPASQGTAVVVVTHDRAVASGAQRVLELSRGRISS